LKLGVNWYLTKDDTNSNDGKYIEYLQRKEYFQCDPELHSFLSQCISQGNRDVKQIADFYRFLNVTFYNELLHIEHIKALSEKGRNERTKLRSQWFENSLQQLKNTDIIFCDPDNGLETKSLSKVGKDSVKFVFADEIKEMLNRGHSVIFYNHRDRSKDKDYRDRFKTLIKNIDHKGQYRIIRFNRYSVRDYVMIMHDEHAGLLNEKIDEMLNEYKNMFLEYV